MDWRFKYAILFFLMFLISVYYRWQELVYLVRGNTAMATVTETYTMKSGRFRQHEERMLEYKGAITHCRECALGLVVHLRCGGSRVGVCPLPVEQAHG